MLDNEKIEKIKAWLGSGSINIFGLPLSGKDTQCSILANLLHGNSFGGGEIIRDKNNRTPKNIASYARDGALSPSDNFLNFILPHLKNPKLDGKPLLLSSLGRWHGEEGVVVNALKDSNHPLKAVLYLFIPKNESLKRRQALEINDDRSGRIDDTKAKLSVRFKEFNEKTLPVIEYYRTLGLLIEIDGVGSRDKITSLLIDALYKKASKLD